MSKSIYEEAIEILLNMGTEFISVPCNPIGEENSDKIHLRDATETYETNMRGVVKTLKQAQKQKELLGYYIELVETIEILERDYNYGLFKFNGIKYTYNKINELENEKEERK